MSDVRPVGLLRISLLLLATAVVISAAGLVYTNRVAHQSERKWCEVISTLDEGFQSNPAQPSTPRGRKLRDDIHQLRADLGCGPG